MDNHDINKQIEDVRQACASIKPMVAIRCIAYNQEKYVRDALEGFVMQKTDFPFVAIVHDDASTDGTAAIIREYAEKYPHIIFPIFESENQYSKRDGSIAKIMDRVTDATGAKYVAICEGDDYWTDSLKLQRQVLFLDANPEYGMCYTKVQRKNQLSGEERIFGGPSQDFNSLLEGNTIPTLSVVCRHTLGNTYSEARKNWNVKWLMGDYPKWLYIASQSKIKFLDEVTGVYRVLSESASHSKSLKRYFDFKRNYRSISIFYCDKYSDLVNPKAKVFCENEYLWAEFLYDIAACNTTYKYIMRFFTKTTFPLKKRWLFLLGWLPFAQRRFLTYLYARENK